MNTFGMPQPALVAVAAFLLAACGQDSPVPLGPSPVASLTVAPATHTVLVGETVLLVATVKDGAGNVLTDRAVAWLSSNPLSLRFRPRDSSPACWPTPRSRYPRRAST